MTRSRASLVGAPAPCSIPPASSHTIPAMMRLSVALLVVGCTGEFSVGDADTYLDQLPDYPDAPPPHDRAVGEATFEYGDNEVCSSTTYSIADAPEEVIMFSADPQIFWPGALIQGDSYEEGSPLLLPLSNRAPMNLSISGLFAGQTAEFDVEPAQSSITDAMNRLLNGAVREEVPSTQSVFFQQSEAYSFDQSALELGFSARYLGARVEGQLSYETSREVNTVAANATIRTFTISVDQPPTPSAFFQGVSARELQEQVDLGRISENNVPVYVASVTYGQILMFSASSSASMSDLKASLAASFNSFAGGGSANLSGEQQQLLQESSIQVVTLGGSEDGVREMIQNGDPSAFFQDSTVVTSSVPIGYTLKDLHGNVVKVGETSEYGLTTCSPNGFANFYVGNQQGNGDVLGFYADGTQADLNAEIEDQSHPILGMVHDTLRDLIIVMHQDGTGSIFSFLRAYEANGNAPSEPAFANGGNESYLFASETNITYDEANARFYTSGSFGGCQEVHLSMIRAWALDGEPLSICFDVPYPDDITGGTDAMVSRDADYAEALDRLFVAVAYDGVDGRYGSVEVFDKRGNRLTEPGTFEGIEDPTAITWDPNHARIYVAESDGRIHVFTEEGDAISLPNAFPTLASPVDLHFDTTYNRLYVVEQGASLVSAFEPDGSEAQGLARPQFPGLNRPSALAFRPN